MPLSSASIASIRSSLSSLSRGDIKQVLLEAGAKAERILPVLIINDMKSPKYLTKDTIISLLFDSIYADFEKDEADKVLLNLVDIVKKRGIDISDIRNKLKVDGMNPNDVNSSVFSEPAEVFSEFAEQEKNKQVPLIDPESVAEGKYSGSKISLDFQDADIVPIFRLLSDISGHNIVVSPEVSGKITLKLINVPWDQALDIILKTFYLGKSIEGNIMRIAPLSIFLKESEEKAKVRVAEFLTEPLETRVFHVSNAEVAVIEKNIKDLKMLTPRGSISMDKRTRVIFIQDIPIIFPQVERILSILDKPTSVNDARKKDNMDATYDYDAFICHASEDKDSFVRPLAKELRDKDLKVWYDEFSLKVGDSLRRSIDRGLAQSRFGIVVLSPSFFEKEWPQRELDGLTAREIHGVKVILPVWHNVSRQDVMHYSPVLADRVGVLTNRGTDHVVAELLDVVQPSEKLLDEKALKFMRAIRLLLEENNKEYRVVVEHLSEMLEQAVPALIESQTFSDFVKKITGDSPEIIDVNTYAQAENYLELHGGVFRYTSCGGRKDTPDDRSAVFLAIRHNDRHIIINSNALQKFESLHRDIYRRMKV